MPARSERARSWQLSHGRAETVGSQSEQLGRGREVPVGRGRAHMAHVCREQRQSGIDVDVIWVPAEQGGNSEGVAQAMRVKPGRRRTRLDAGTACHRKKSSSYVGVLEAGPSGGGEEARLPERWEKPVAQAGVVAQRSGRARVQGKITALAK